MSEIESIIERCGNSRENLLEILHAIQNSNPEKYLPKEDIHKLAELMQLPVSEIMSTASFYTMFSFKPRGQYIIRLCESPPCFIKGSENILNAISKKLDISVGETTEDGFFSLETSSCLGLCGVAPAMMINNDAFGNLTENKTAEILDKLREEVLV